MSNNQEQPSSSGPGSAMDGERSSLYTLLAALLAAEPTHDVLRTAAGIEAADTKLGNTLNELAGLAANADPEALRDEYFQLFVGVGRGLLVPYGSYYLTGFLNEKPLARLRADMARLGIERDPDIKEPEDHIATVFEIMAGLLSGVFEAGDQVNQEVEAHRFFEAHIAPWASVFFNDLAETSVSPLYCAVGRVGCAFIDIEQKAFDYAA
ncbi:MAG: molecular chaperone TorD family protein [Pseudomonadota bacterium]